MANYNEKLFRKWFGEDNDKQNDIMVKTRIRNTYNFMNDGFEDRWNVVCCKNQKGTCAHCSGRVMAYVMGSNATSGTKMSQNWMRLCPMMFAPKMLDDEIGLTIYHELQHMTSAVYDHPSKAYAKKSMVELAVEDPVGARLNSATYTMYIAETGMNREDFTKYTRTSGNNAKSAKCFDKHSNCNDLAKGCCNSRKTSDGLLLKFSCCAACTHESETNSAC